MLSIFTEGSKQFVRQGPGYFGTYGTGIEVKNHLPHISIQEIEFSDSDTDILPIPAAGGTYLDILAVVLTAGNIPFSLQAMRNWLSDIVDNPSLYGFEKDGRFARLLRLDIRRYNGITFPFESTTIESGNIQRDMFYYNLVNVFKLKGQVGNRLAAAVALSEAQRSLQIFCKKTLNWFFFGGEVERRTKPEGITPYILIQELAKLSQPGEYYVKKLFSDLKKLTGNDFIMIQKHIDSLVLTPDISEESHHVISSHLVEYIPTQEGSIGITQRHIKEYELLFDCGYYDKNPKARLVLTKGELNSDGKPNISNAIFHSIDNLQDRYTNGIPINELEQNCRVILAGVQHINISDVIINDFRHKLYNTLKRKNDSDMLGEIKDNKLFLFERIVIAEDVPNYNFDLHSYDKKEIHYIFEFRKRIIEYWLELNKGENTRIPVSKAREIYASVMGDMGIFLSKEELQKRTSSLFSTYDLEEETEARIKLNQRQFDRIKRIWKILSGISDRYKYLSGDARGQEYIKDMFGNDIGEDGDRIASIELPSERKSLIKSVLVAFLNHLLTVDLSGYTNHQFNTYNTN